MAEVNLRSWWERSQASEGLQWNSTAATWENILARLARLETRLVEHERRVAATHSPLRPEPDPPDQPWLCGVQPPHAPYQPMPESYHCYPPPSVANLRTTQAKPSLLILPPPQTLLSRCEQNMANNRESVNPVEESESDSSEEGSSSEEESDADLDPTPPQNKPQPQIPVAKPSQPLPHPSSDDEDDFGSETESESDAPEVRQLAAKPVEETPKSNRKAKSKPAADPVTPGKSAAASKRPAEDTASKDAKKPKKSPAAAPETAEKKSNMFQRLWSKEDEIVILGGDEGRRAAVRCAFDPGGDVSSCVVISTLRTRWISTVGELIRDISINIPSTLLFS